VGLDVFGVVRFHDYDQVCPVDQLLGQMVSTWEGCCSSRSSLPYSIPVAEEVLCSWTSLEVGGADEKHIHHCLNIPALQIKRAASTDIWNRLVQDAHYLISFEFTDWIEDFKLNPSVCVTGIREQDG